MRKLFMFKRFALDQGRKKLYVIILLGLPITYDTGRGELLFGGKGMFINRWLRKSHYAWLWSQKWRYSPLPVYWSRYSRDCDQYSVSWYERHSNGWKAYRAYCDALDNAEGPEHFHRVKRAEYEEYKNEGHTRDHAAEQMNY